MQRILIFFSILFFSGVIKAQNVTNVYTDYSYSRTVNGNTTNFNVWTSGDGAINPVMPDRSHNVLGFTVGGVNYSTGVNDPLLSTVLSPTAYSPQQFQAFPVGLISAPGSDTVIGVGNNFGGGPGNVSPIPVTSNLANYLTDGSRGLDLGTAIFNLPSASQLQYSVLGINRLSLGDGVPDIFITQVGQIPNVTDRFKFLDERGNIVGNEFQINFSNVNRVGIGSWKFYRPTNPPTYDAGLQGPRDIRLLALDFSVFGIDATNYLTVKFFVQVVSGNSDQAFTAYNTRSVSLLQNVSGSVFNDNDAGIPNGNGYAGATLKLMSGTTLVATTTTDNSGSYNFPNIATGNYTVVLTVPNNYQIVGNTAGNTTSVVNAQVTGNSGSTNNNFGINMRPLAVNDTASGFKSTPLTINLTGNDSDPSAGIVDPTSVNLVPPSNASSVTTSGGNIKGFTIIGQGTFLVNNSGVLVFTPATGFSGNASVIQYSVKDNAGLTSNLANINIFIEAFCTRNPTTLQGGIPSIFGITNLEKANNWPQSVPNGAVVLESNSKGFVITRVQNSTLISDAKEGMIIYDIDANCVKLYNGTSWKCIQRDCNQ